MNQVAEQTIRLCRRTDGGGTDQWARTVVQVVDIDGARARVRSFGGICPRCETSAGCGAATFLRFFGSPVSTLWVRNDLGASVGDQVEIGIRHATLLRLAALFYLLPLAGLAAGATLAFVAGLDDAGSALVSAVGLVAGFMLSRLLCRAMDSDEALSPVGLRRVTAGDEVFVDVPTVRGGR